MTKAVIGIVHGKTIELAQELGIPDGQRVEIIVQTTKPSAGELWGDGMRRCAGAMADSWTDEDDRILEQHYQERKADSRGEAAD